MIKKIVLTGGPCAGKSTAISKIRKEFSEKGFNVIIVPETATELINMGIKPFGENKISLYEFQKFIFKYQLYKEKLVDDYINLNKDKDILVIFDRGIMDNAAYVKDEEFDKLLYEFNIDKSNLFTRYDNVIHMLTAAKGTNFYTLENNEARSETKEEAINLDDKILESYLGFPHLRVIDNSTNFEEKVNKVVSEILNITNKTYIQKQRKYIVDINSINKDKLETNSRKFEITQNYNFVNGKELMIRKMSFSENNLYYLSIKSDLKLNSERIITERILTEKEYNDLINSFNENVINKTRYCFSYKDINFRLDIIENELALLEVEGEYENIEFPNFIDVLEDVTDNLEYRNSNLIKNNKILLNKR